MSRSVSISISSVLKTQSEETIKSEEQPEVLNQQNEAYSSTAFEKAWRAFGQTVPELVSVVSYINNNLPEKIEDHTYEITFSNIFQENEFKKLLPDLCSSIRNSLKNYSINFITKVVETTERDTNRNPEEIFKKMAEQNPALQALKKNLNLEVD